MVSEVGNLQEFEVAHVDQPGVRWMWLLLLPASLVQGPARSRGPASSAANAPPRPQRLFPPLTALSL